MIKIAVLGYGTIGSGVVEVCLLYTSVISDEDLGGTNEI